MNTLGLFLGQHPVHIYIYICMPEVFFVPLLWLLECYFLCHRFSKMAFFQKPQGKLKLEIVPRESSFLHHPAIGEKMTRKKWYSFELSGGTASNSLSALCFSIFGTNCVILAPNQLKTQVGISVVQFATFSNLGVSFSNITWLISF